MALPLMPKATAVWLVENTSLSLRPDRRVLRPPCARGAGDRRWRGGGADAGARPRRQRPAHARGDRALPEGPGGAAEDRQGGAAGGAGEARGPALHADRQAPGQARRDRLAREEPSRAAATGRSRSSSAPPSRPSPRCATARIGTRPTSSRAIRWRSASARWKSSKPPSPAPIAARRSRSLADPERTPLAAASRGAARRAPAILRRDRERLPSAMRHHPKRSHPASLRISIRRRRTLREMAGGLVRPRHGDFRAGPAAPGCCRALWRRRPQLSPPAHSCIVRKNFRSRQVRRSPGQLIGDGARTSRRRSWHRRCRAGQRQRTIYVELRGRDGKAVEPSPHRHHIANSQQVDCPDGAAAHRMRRSSAHAEPPLIASAISPRAAGSSIVAGTRTPRRRRWGAWCRAGSCPSASSAGARPPPRS